MLRVQVLRIKKLLRMQMFMVPGCINANGVILMQ
jgi:hypothetical protein